MREEYQAIIVGSGPAGAACAKALNNEGVEALVIEKDKLPRNKICSAVLFGQTQVLLDKYFDGLPPEDVYCDPKIIKADNILEWKKGKGFFNYIWELPKDGRSFPKDFYNVWRSKFDYWLLNESGVAYRDDCKFNNYSIDNGKIKVEISRNGKDNINLYCSYLIGADGGGSRLRPLLDPSFMKIEQTLSIYQAYYRYSNIGSLKDAHWYVFFEPQIGDAFSVVHRKDDFLTLCVCGFKGRSLKKSMEDFKNLLADNFQVVLKDMERDEGCVVKKAPPCLGKGNIILTGEAAGIFYLNGEGISASIDSGYRAGKAVAHGIKEGGNVLEIYGKEMEGILNHMKMCVEKTHMFVV